MYLFYTHVYSINNVNSCWDDFHIAYFAFAFFFVFALPNRSTRIKFHENGECNDQINIMM